MYPQGGIYFGNNKNYKKSIIKYILLFKSLYIKSLYIK